MNTKTLFQAVLIGIAVELIIVALVMASVAHAADYGYQPQPPLIVQQPAPIIVEQPPVILPEPRCHYETTRNYDEDGDYSGSSVRTDCD